MGINGLLPVLKPVCSPKNIREFANLRVGVDIHGWIHRGAFSCAGKLCRGIDTNAYVDFCMHRVRMLIHFNARPVLVFDGSALPMKADTHAERRSRREDALEKAEEFRKAGNTSKAENWYQRAYSVTSEMVLQVIRECRKINVEYVVAPYEADAQLAWMIKTGYIDTVITEDSDLLVYGASNIFFKMNRNGDGDMYESKNLPSLDALQMHNFTPDMFLYMCVCSGCDFFKGVQGLGIKKAHAIVNRTRTMKRLVLYIRHNRRFKVSNSFEIDFAKASMVFRHQTVFDMKKKQHIHLNELDDVARAMLPARALKQLTEMSDYSFLGAHREPSLAIKISEGRVHPRTLEEYTEPLDTVARPLRPFRLPNFASPAKRQRTTPISEKVKGFQVQPISSSQSASMSDTTSRSQPVSASQTSSYSRAINLRQRLANRQTGSSTFNPRRAGAAFRTKHSSANGGSGIWSGFKRNATREGSVQHSDDAFNDQAMSVVLEIAAEDKNEGDEFLEQLGSGLGRQQDLSASTAVEITPPPPSDDWLEGDEGSGHKRGDEITLTCDDFDAEKEEEKDNQENVGDTANEIVEKEEEIRAKEDSIEKQQDDSEVVKRSKAAARAIGRFAAKSAVDVKKKFIPKTRVVDIEEDTKQQEGGETVTVPVEKKRKPEEDVPVKRRRSDEKKNEGNSPGKAVVQLRLSRFFANIGEVKKGTEGSRSVSGASKRNQRLSLGVKKTGDTMVRKKRSSVPLRSVDSFRRGVNGRKVRLSRAEK